MKSLSFDFVLDTWAELKAKRLAPVAVGLAVLVVAMPAVLLEGGGDVGDAPLPIVAPPSAGGTKVEVAEELAERGSKLDSYGSRDPFKGKIRPEAKADAGLGTASAPSGGLGGSAPAKGSKLPSLGSSGSTTSSGSSGSGGSSPSGPVRPPSSVTKPRLYRYNYQLDVKFGRPGREKRYEDVKRMTFLPKPSLPALLFMGVPVGESSALFFVYPGLTHQGEGRCVPSPRECNFLELEIGEQHYLAANDFEFRIELLKIKRVKMRNDETTGDAPRKVSGRRSGRLGDPRADRQSKGTTGDYGSGEYDFPWLVDALG